MLGLGVERGGRLVEHEDERSVAHEAAGERELLPLPEGDLDAVVPRRPELRVEPGGEPLDDVVGAGPADRVGRPPGGRRCGARRRRPTVRLGEELEPEEVLERAGQPLPPLVARDAGEVDAVDE